MSSRTKFVLAFVGLPTILILVLMLVGLALHSTSCPTWCLTCVTPCSLMGINLDWLMTLGLIYAPPLLCVALPVLFLVAAFSVHRKRRGRGTSSAGS